MGLRISRVFRESDDEDGGLSKPSMGDLPEGCVALILSRVDPIQICGLARLNRVFRGASSADFIWESKLPSNYKFLVHQAIDDFPLNVCKKNIYAGLCQPRFFDAGTKTLWLDKSTGGFCLAISSKGLSITGIDDRRYWSQLPTNESRFQTISYLQQTWWFEVGGEIAFQFPVGTYSLYFRLHLGKAYKRWGRRMCDLEHIHGWDKKPVRFELATSDGQNVVSQSKLQNPGVWEYYHAGDFEVHLERSLLEIKFTALQIDCTHTKGGLSVDSVFICPKGLGMEVRAYF